MIAGITYETLYFYGLLLSGGLTILYAIFGDVFDLDVDGVFSPILLLCFTTFLSAIGFLLEFYTSFTSPIILIISIAVALLLALLSYNFIFIPIKRTQASLAFNEKSLEGTVGTVITVIPAGDGFGEILIKNATGSIARSAKSVNGEEIGAGETVMVFEIKNRVAEVIPYKPFGE